MIADKGYDSDALRERLRRRGIALIAPPLQPAQHAAARRPDSAALQAPLDRRTQPRLARQLPPTGSALRPLAHHLPSFRSYRLLYDSVTEGFEIASKAGKEWGWFWLFPSGNLSVDPQTLVVRRHHLHPASLQRAFRMAVQQPGSSKPVSVHTLRHYADPG